MFGRLDLIDIGDSVDAIDSFVNTDLMLAWNPSMLMFVTFPTCMSMELSDACRSVSSIANGVTMVLHHVQANALFMLWTFIFFPSSIVLGDKPTAITGTFTLSLIIVIQNYQ